jgi:hypothetical protein
MTPLSLMRQRGWTLLAIACAVLAAGATSVRAAEDPAIEAIRELYRTSNEAAALGAALIAFYETEKGWKQAADPNAKSWDDGNENGYEVGRIYSRNGKPVKVVAEFHTPSGDWRDSVEYYFYEDGKVAFAFEKETTYNGVSDTEPKPFVIEIRKYYDRSGKLIRKLFKVYTEKTGKVLDREDLGLQVHNFSDVTDIAKFGWYAPYRSLPH